MKENGIAVLGGTFDPVHNAHLEMARAALKSLPLDKLLFMPTGLPGYRNAPVAPAQDRVAMLKLAIAGEPRCELDLRELGPDATGFTVDTLGKLRAELGLRLPIYLLIGGDQFAAFDRWHRPQDVKRLAKLAVFARPGVKIDPVDTLMIPMPPTAISATDIRARAARGEDLAALVPPAVANYISSHGLYR
jgi:nicotinate-nucleotide adenylyltransferase